MPLGVPSRSLPACADCCPPPPLPPCRASSRPSQRRPARRQGRPRPALRPSSSRSSRSSRCRTRSSRPPRHCGRCRCPPAPPPSRAWPAQQRRRRPSRRWRTSHPAPAAGRATGRTQMPGWLLTGGGTQGCRVRPRCEPALLLWTPTVVNLCWCSCAVCDAPLLCNPGWGPSMSPPAMLLTSLCSM